MPSKLYNKFTKTQYESEEEMIRGRKYRDNIKQKIRYYKKKFGYILDYDDIDLYNQFVQNLNVIKKVHKFHNFILQYKEPKDKLIIKTDAEIYYTNKSNIDLGLEYIEFLKKLTHEESEQNIQNNINRKKKDKTTNFLEKQTIITF
jgi:hypothetical protein|tara:strand:- start:588 stop:1025 length:438 start_codon:yes stop_codon:yes gene_type:complete